MANKKVLTSLELYAVINELNFLEGAIVDKIYQISSKELLINLYKTGLGKKALKIDSGHGMYLTNYELKKPPYPSSFCMFMRKNLNRSSLVKIKQRGLERIVEIHFKTKSGVKILILELFSKGNFILTDSDYKIINVANVQKWKHRTIKKGETYIYPPQNSTDLFGLTYNKFKEILESDKELVKFLAVNLGLGGIYSEEICENLSFDKSIIVNKLDEKKAKEVFVKLKEIVSRFESFELNPKIVKEDSKIIDAVPFKISKYSSYEDVKSWNSALDIYFTGVMKNELKERKGDKFKEKLSKLEIVLEKQEKLLKDYENKSEKYKNIADKLYRYYDSITEIITKISKAKEVGYPIEQIREAVEKEKAEGISEAELIKKVNHDSIIIDLGEDVEFVFNESIEKTAEFFYEKSKDFKEKIPGAKKIIKETKRKINNLKNKEEKIKKEIIDDMPSRKEKIRVKWFEKFHWFYTYNGKLAIGGRDATQNDILIKKYLEPKDLVFHTEMAGSPFFILKNGADADEKELKSVAIATVSYSRAWRKGLGSTDAYYVRPEQVSKQAPSGEYVGKGAWMIRGKKNLFKDVKLEIGIGLTKEGEIISGPSLSVGKKSKNYVILKPGWTKKSKIAKKIIKEFNLSSKNLDKIIRYLPAGESTIINTIT